MIWEPRVAAEKQDHPVASYGCLSHRGYHHHSAYFEMAGGGCSTISGISKHFDGASGELLKSLGIERKRDRGVFIADKLKFHQRAIF